MLLRFGTVFMGISLALVATIFTATAIYSKPEQKTTDEKVSEPRPLSTERPVGPKKLVRKSELPEIKPESADLPELPKKKKEIVKEVSPPPPPTPKPPPELREEPAPEQQKPPRAKPEINPQQQRDEREGPRQRKERPQEQKKLRSLPAEAQKKKPPKKAKPGPDKRVEAQKVEPSKKAKPEPKKSNPAATAPPATSSLSKQPQDMKMVLSAGSIGIRNERIESTSNEKALDEGLIHLPQTSTPWDRAKSRNVYVVGHRVGWPDTGSWKLFYRLNELKRGDELKITTRRGKTYRYKVSEKLVVSPQDVWVTEPVKGRDMLSLQTCIGENFSKRLVIRADRV